MTEIDKAITFLSNILAPEPFHPLEQQILRYSFESKSYQQIAADYNCDSGYVKKIAEYLWEKVSLKLGEPVTKSNCRNIIKRHLLVKQKSENSKPVAEFWINGRGLGKARPRHSAKNKRVHMPSNYVQWMNRAVFAIKLQMKDKPPAPIPAYVECYFVNFLSCDSDNLIGSVEDALVKVSYLGNDSSSYVVDSRGRFAKIPKRRGIPLDMGILVRIYEGEIIELEPDLVDEFRIKYPQLFVSANKK